jgi:hypothetical protein
MIWAHFKNKQKENSKEDFDLESKRKMSKRELRSRWEQQVKIGVIQKEGIP